jgi:esterase/lipase
LIILRADGLQFSSLLFWASDLSLLDALKIQKVLGYSLGSFVAQQLSIPQNLQLVKFFSEMVSKSINHIPITKQDVKILLSIPTGSAWMKSHPNFLESAPEAKDLFAGVPPNTVKQQNDISQAWMGTNWSGVCDELTKVSSPTLIITGNHDNNVPSANALIIAGKIPGAWLVQIRDAGHALIMQYPDKVNKVLQTFLSSTMPS